MLITRTALIDRLGKASAEGILQAEGFSTAKNADVHWMQWSYPHRAPIFAISIDPDWHGLWQIINEQTGDEALQSTPPNEA